MHRTTRITLALVTALILLLAIVAAWSSPFVKSMLGLAPEDRVFATVQIGDTEQHLIELLDAYGIDYSKENSGPSVLYSHVDGFMGVCFYYVTDGHVTSMAKD